MKLDLLTIEQRAIVLDFLEGKSALATMDGKTYAWKREADVYAVHGLEGQETHYVSSDLSSCTCADNKYRGRECKHMRTLRAIL